MAPVEHPELTSEVRPDSVGSRTSAAPQPAIERWALGPWTKVVAKALGIGLLMLGLGGIGALAMAQGLTPHDVPVVETRTSHAPSKPAGRASHAASLAGAMPGVGPGPAPPARAPDTPTAKPASGVTEDGRVILNLANATELRQLPGIGQKRAEAILALRKKLGRFKRATDLLRIRGIGRKRLLQMLPKLVLDPPAEAAKSGPPSADGGRSSPKASAQRDGDAK